MSSLIDTVFVFLCQYCIGRIAVPGESLHTFTYVLVHSHAPSHMLCSRYWLAHPPTRLKPSRFTSIECRSSMLIIIVQHILPSLSQPSSLSADEIPWYVLLLCSLFFHEFVALPFVSRVLRFSCTRSGFVQVDTTRSLSFS